MGVFPILCRAGGCFQGVLDALSQESVLGWPGRMGRWREDDGGGRWEAEVGTRLGTCRLKPALRDVAAEGTIRGEGGMCYIDGTVYRVALFAMIGPL